MRGGLDPGLLPLSRGRNTIVLTAAGADQSVLQRELWPAFVSKPAVEPPPCLPHRAPAASRATTSWRCWARIPRIGGPAWTFKLEGELQSLA